MIKTRHFNLMKVYDSHGKYLGVVQDIGIDFYNGIIKGFIISSFKLNKKNNYVDIEDVISLQDVIIVKKVMKFEGVRFKEIYSIDVIDDKNMLKGVLEDLIIDEETFEIKGLVICSGIFDKMFKGKEILLIKHCILGEGYIIYEENNKVTFKTMPHNLGVNIYEKN